MKAFKNMKIGKKLLWSYVVIIVLFAASAVTGIVSVSVISGNMENFYNQQFQVVQASQMLKTDIQGYAKGLARMQVASQPIEGKTEEERADSFIQKTEEMQKFLDTFGTDLETLNSLDVSSREELAVINENYPILQDLTKQLEQLYAQGEVGAADELASGSIDEAGYGAGDALNIIIEEGRTQAKDKYDRTMNLVKNIYLILILISVSIVIVTVGFCLVLTRSITKPLGEMEYAAKQLAQGQLNQEIQYESGDELGSLAANLRETIQTLQLYISEIDGGMNAIGTGKLNYQIEMDFRGDFRSLKNSMENISANLTSAMIQINASADQVMRGAEQISGSGQALSQATLEQASSVEELGETINEVSTRINENAQNAMGASKLTEALGEEITVSSEQMQQMSTVMKQMKEMSSDIKGIIKDIEDIAFQTNILSLNAAVEAARAGEAGKGFSVVANEIRRLSAKTTEASKKTGDLINQTVEMMIEGADMAEQTSDKLSDVVRSSREAAEKVDLISRASNDQATAVVQLRQSIAMISDIVQENSATAEESAASSEELTGQMQMLKELVGAFEYEE